MADQLEQKSENLKSNIKQLQTDTKNEIHTEIAEVNEKIDENEKKQTENLTEV